MVTKVVSCVIVSVALLMSSQGYAQPVFGNEWINPAQPYVKIPVAKDGIYRITLADLQAIGFPTTPANNIQLWHRGKQYARRIEAGQYIEFYGQKNDGTSDKELYLSGTQPHSYYNLFTDTTAYFLTLNLSQPGVAMDAYSDNTVLTPEAYHHQEHLILFARDYATGIRYNESGITYVQSSQFETGEGWSDRSISEGQARDTLIQGLTAQAAAIGNPEPTIEIQLMGRSRGAHPYEIIVGSSAPSRVVATGTFSEFEVVTISAPLTWTDFSVDGKLLVRVNALSGGAGSSYRLSINYIKIRYPQELNMEGSTERIFWLPENAAGKSFLQIQNAPAGTRLFDITDPQQVALVSTTASATLNAVIRNTDISRKIYAVNMSAIITPTIKRVYFRSLTAAPKYVIVSHPVLMKPAGGYANPVKAYAEFRASEEGGNYDTLVMDINQVYNQFNYGEISPLAIRKLMAYLINAGSTPDYLFIIGKGLEISYGYHRKPSSWFKGYHDLVPTGGLPASDMMFTVGLGNSPFEPAVATGRLSVSNPHEVANYLTKVKQMEVEVEFNDLWRKEVLHISGGIYFGEPTYFKFILSAIGKNADDFYFGGKVSALAKNSQEIDEFINISDKVNSGVSLVTLFGHSSSSSADFNIGYVSAPELGYNNTKRYPVFLLNGCEGGKYFDTELRYGEDWVFKTNNKGALGFMANTGFGYSDVLSYYSDTFYKVAFKDSVFINRGVGVVQKEVAGRMINGLNEESDTIRYLAQAHQMILLGDPVVKIFGAGKPDYEINDSQVELVSLNDEPVTALSDSFALKIAVRNFGVAWKDSLAVRITQIFNDLSSVTYDSIFPAVLFSDTLTFTIPRNEKGFGENTFEVELDPSGSTTELNENNNKARISRIIPIRIPKNLYPNNFSIVSTPSVQLLVQSTDLVAEARDFIIELDTVPAFASAFKKTFLISGKIASQEVELLSGVDTLAYYWRTKFSVTEPNEKEEWIVSSFTYVKEGNEGWAQVHFPQYELGNTTNTLILDAESRQIRLEETITNVDIVTFGADNPNYTVNQYGTVYQPETSVRVGGTEYHPISLIQEGSITPCRKNSINLVAFSKTTTTPYISVPEAQTTVFACGRRPEIIASFISSEVDRTEGVDLIQYIENVPAGDSVVLFAVGNPGYSVWSANARNKLSELGISLDQINSIVEGEPVIIFAKKGSSPGTAIIHTTTLEPREEQGLEVEGTITGRPPSGTMTSSLIGPAVAWHHVYTKTAVSEQPITDTYSFDIIGQNLSGQETLLMTNLSGSAIDISSINALTYPYLELVFHAVDEINLTPPQLKNWMVTYTPAAEGVIVYNGNNLNQTMQEGEVWSDAFGFQNISSKQFSDSLVVQYSFFNTTNRETFADTKKILAPLPGEQTEFTLTENTLNKVGFNNLKVNVNPKIQPEVYYDNNTFEFKNYLQILADEFNPVLDVTIDGRHIMNGDYASANPTIKIELWDENRLIYRTDTIGVDVFLKYPCDQEECDFTRINYSRTDVTWTSANTSSPFKVEFHPQGLAPGPYTLQIKAQDVRGNASGSLSEANTNEEPKPFEVSFVVSDENLISVKKPYPNPSSSVFTFDVVVSSDLLPDMLQLEIVNTEGRTISNFIADSFYTGTNSFVWNGNGSDGHPLPDGLYLYRVKLLRTGEVLSQSSGKLMLFRK